MSEQFNQELSLSGKIPSGLFNTMFGFRGCWQKDAAATRSLTLDGWFITLYNIELARSHITLSESVKKEVPASWDPVVLAEVFVHDEACTPYPQYTASWGDTSWCGGTCPHVAFELHQAYDKAVKVPMKWQLVTHRHV
ncbi:hypothetical protein U1Q18_009223 [Sarracenia purpurea var. burkii]